MAASQQDVLRLLKEHSYADVQAMTGLSKGRIYRIALAAHARKTEERIVERARLSAHQRVEESISFLRSAMNRVIRADALSFLKMLPDDSMALCLTSPPYNVDKRYGGHRVDNNDHLSFYSEMGLFIAQAERILMPGGMLVMVVGTTIDHRNHRKPMAWMLESLIEKTSLVYQNEGPWITTHGLTPKHRLAERHETVLFFSKGEEPRRFHATPGRTPQHQPEKRAFKGPNAGELSGCYLGAHPTDVFTETHVKANHPEATEHPCAMPLEFVERLMLIYTDPGDAVVDPYGGRGTVAMAARRTHRNFLVSDLFYEQLRVEQLRSVSPNLVSPLPGVSEHAMSVWRDDTRGKGNVQSQLSLVS